MAKLFSPAFRLFAKDRWVQLTFLPAGLLCLVGSGAVLWAFPRQENAVLHYNVYFGIDLLGNWYNALLIPLAGLLLVLLNAVVAAFVWRSDRVVSYLLGIGTVLLAMVAAVATGLLVYVNV